MKNAFYSPLSAESVLWLFANFLYLPRNIKLSAFDKNDHYFSVSPSCQEINDALKFPGSLFTPIAPRRRPDADVYASGGTVENDRLRSRRVRAYVGRSGTQEAETAAQHRSLTSTRMCGKYILVQ